MESFLQGNEKLVGQDINFVTGKGITVSELARLVKEISGSNSDIQVKDARPFDVQNFVGDPSKARELLGLELNVDLQTGLRRYLAEITQMTE